MADAIGSQSLLSIYGVYEKLKGKDTTGASSSSSSGNTTGASAPKPAEAVSTPTPESEGFKSQGNAAMARKDHPAAIDLYSKAIAIAPMNPIYLSNRAAAYSASHKHAEACTDAEMAVAADPKYTKAWSRLGLARFVLGDARGSMEAYGQGIEYEGNGGSEAMKKGFKTAKEKVDELEREREAGGLEEDLDDGTSARGASGGGGMPDLSALAGMMGGGGGGRGGGGMPDLGGLMSNPMFANMAQNLMSNPETLQGLMNNPQLRGMAERFGLGGGGAGGAGTGGGGGGMPDLSALAGMLGGGGRGGAGEAGAGRGGGASGGGGMPDLAAMMNDPNIAEM